MRLESYASSQYAGTRDRDLAFAPGMNVVLGDNEAGKSTMISGIMDTLLASVKLDRRRDKDFVRRRFPTDGANFIDGQVRLELSGERVEVRKEWDRADPRESRAVLQYLDSGRRLTGAPAEEALRTLLRYGGAVYQKVVFGRQDNEEEILDWFFSFLRDETADGLAEAKERVTGAAAAAAAGGVSEEVFLARLEEKLAELGDHWDFERDGPAGGRGLNSRWKNKVGSILAAWYAWQETGEACEAGEALIRRTAGTERRLGEQRAEKQRLKARQEALHKQRTAIQTAELLRRQRDSLTTALEELNGDGARWPRLTAEQTLLDGLLAEDAERRRRGEKEALERTLDAVRACDGEIAALRRALEGKEDIEADAGACRALQNGLDRVEARLGAARLTARVVLEEGFRAGVETADGQAAREARRFDGAVNGFVRVRIPGVGEVTVSPGDLDVDALQRERAEKRETLRALLQKYALETCGELERAAAGCREARAALERGEGERKSRLAGRTVEELAAALDRIETHPNMAVGEDLDARIREALGRCREAALESRAAVVAKELADLEEKYASPEELEKKRSAAEEALAKAGADLAQAGEAPMTREDYDRETGRLARDLEALEEELEDTLRTYAGLAGEADELDLDALQAERSAWAEELEKQKRLYRQYSRIREDFLRIREGQADPYGRFYALFNRYLSIAAGDGLRVSGEDGVCSGNNALPGKEFLSQGTRKSILLAFRLALLKYYYPEESGLVVLDDVLLDMDPGRRAGAAALLREFARENQVIFTTCDPAVADLLGGHRIQL